MGDSMDFVDFFFPLSKEVTMVIENDQSRENNRRRQQRPAATPTSQEEEASEQPTQIKRLLFTFF
jgi:hypothetical protein